jgi:hypothetical protein
MASSSDSDNVLFFIPDIGGFTRFVTTTEISHSQHIIKDLLEVLVDSNHLDMQVSEVEGDAVLFARTGRPPRFADLLSQTKKMYVDFHSYLKQFEMLRICQCGACIGASKISLKVIVHAGPASAMDVKGHSKFIGSSVIIAHRLLKNSVPLAEYLLVTQETMRQLEGTTEAPASPEGSNHYDEIGEIHYRYWPLADYLSEVKVRPPKPFGIDRPRYLMHMSCTMKAPPADVYQTLIDLPARMQWEEGIKEIEIRDLGPNQIGKVHRCVRGDHDPDLVTSDVKITATTMEFWETDTRKMGTARYLVERSPGDSTRLTFEFYCRDNLFVRLLFKLVYVPQMERVLGKALAKLTALVERNQKLEIGDARPGSIHD